MQIALFIHEPQLFTAHSFPARLRRISGQISPYSYLTYLLKVSSIYHTIRFVKQTAYHFLKCGICKFYLCIAGYCLAGRFLTALCGICFCSSCLSLIGLFPAGLCLCQAGFRIAGFRLTGYRFVSFRLTGLSITDLFRFGIDFYCLCSADSRW